jgi:hypothetical protein
MARVTEIDRAIAMTVGHDEQLIRPPIRARGGPWLVLTDRRVIVFEPRKGTKGGLRVRLNEPVDRVAVRKHWRWRSLGSELVVRTVSGEVSHLGLTSGRGRRTRWGMTRAMRDVESTVARQARLVAEAAPPALVEELAPPPAPPFLVGRLEVVKGPGGDGDAELERQLSAVRLDAVTSRTPAQMARRLGRDPKRLAELLTRRSGIRMSDGALYGDTFNRTDMRVFDDEMKGRLFDWVVEEDGAAKVVAAARGVGPDWWNTSGGRLFESLADFADVSVGHDSRDREPIRGWQKRIVWLGLLGATLATMVSVGILIILMWLWRASYFGWRDGSRSSPTAAVVMGVLTAALLLTALVGILLAPAFRLVG